MGLLSERQVTASPREHTETGRARLDSAPSHNILSLASKATKEDKAVQRAPTPPPCRSTVHPLVLTMSPLSLHLRTRHLSTQGCRQKDAALGLGLEGSRAQVPTALGAPSCLLEPLWEHHGEVPQVSPRVLCSRVRQEAQKPQYMKGVPCCQVVSSALTLHPGVYLGSTMQI